MNGRESTYLISVLAALLRGENAPPPEPGLDWRELYRLASRHSLANMAAYGITEAPEEVQQKFEEAKRRGIFVEATQELELGLVQEAFAKAGLRVMPQKGAILKHLYPKPDMRSMSDLDLLFDPENDEIVHSILTGLGYRADRYREDSVDIYVKPPVMMLELHRSLIREDHPWHEYFSQVWDRADETGHMMPEDFYIFLIAHLAKHYAGKGSGLRPVMDLWVYRGAHTLDEAYLTRELKTLGILEFERRMEELAAFWFGDGVETPFLEELGESVLMNSIYGSSANRAMANRVSISQEESFGRAKTRYVRTRLLPDSVFMARRYPILQKWPVLLPFCWVARWIVTLFRGDRMRGEVEILEQMQEEKTKKLQELHKKLGLK